MLIFKGVYSSTNKKMKHRTPGFLSKSYAQVCFFGNDDDDDDDDFGDDENWNLPRLSFPRKSNHIWLVLNSHLVAHLLVI